MGSLSCGISGYTGWSVDPTSVYVSVRPICERLFPRRADFHPSTSHWMTNLCRSALESARGSVRRNADEIQQWPISQCQRAYFRKILPCDRKRRCFRVQPTLDPLLCISQVGYIDAIIISQPPPPLPPVRWLTIVIN
jgi:hypothetical protein